MSDAVPQIALVRVLTPAGPYEAGDLISVAFGRVDVGRLLPHVSREVDRPDRVANPPDHSAERGVPHVVSVSVLSAAGPYRTAQVLTLSFVDPLLARIHAGEQADYSPGPAARNSAKPLVVEPVPNTRPMDSIAGSSRTHQTRGPETLDSAFESDARPVVSTSTGRFSSAALNGGSSPAAGLESPDSAPSIGSPDSLTSQRDATSFASGDPAAANRLHISTATRARIGPETPELLGFGGTPSPGNQGVTVRFRWTSDRVRRFVQVSDKLFTVDRLGWYRHALVLRLLVPDDVSCPNPEAESAGRSQLGLLREAVAETLGSPLLAAFMPNFSVTSAWLDSLDSGAIARALGAFRDAVEIHAAEEAGGANLRFESAEQTVGTLTRRELHAATFSNIEAALAVLVPHACGATALAEHLGLYRATASELFGQMAGTPEKNRLKQMSQTNHALDDQLWQLLAALQATFEPAPAA